MGTALGYVGVYSPNFKEWTSFGPEILGLKVVEESRDEVRLTPDDQPYRLILKNGDTNKLAYIGWDVGSEQALDEILERLRKASLPFEEGNDELKEERQVLRVVKVRDGIGIDHELYYGPLVRPKSFIPGRPMSGFHTGNQGMGHAVLVTPDKDASNSFFLNVLGMKKSDEIRTTLDLLFYHCNPRHHTAALAAVPGMKGLHHVMFEVNELDDVGIAYDLCQRLKLPISMTLGRHTNDRMLSFYLRTPSGFDVEYGWGGIAVDESWKLVSYERASIWGHEPTGIGLPGTVQAS